MTKLREHRGGSYLKVADLDGREVNVTIEGIALEMVGEGDKAKEKLVARFEGKSKGLVLNDFNNEVIEQAFGPNTEDAVGGHVILYVDPEVRFGGKKVGGIRIRLPKKTAAPKGATGDHLDEEIPF